MARAWILAYDIADPRRLVRVHRRMSQFATPLEYSVFWLEGTENDYMRCVLAIVPLLALDADDLRAYPVPARGLRVRVGVRVLPAGITWTGMPARGWSDSIATALAQAEAGDPDDEEQTHGAA